MALAATTRISWLIAGSAFGLGCFSALSPIAVSWVTPTIHIVGDEQTSKVAGRSLEEIVSAAPELEEGSSSSRKYQPLVQELTVRSGDTLGSLLTGSGISKSEATEIVESVRPHYDPRKLGSGSSLTVEFTKDISEDGKASVASLTLPVSVTTTVEINRAADDAFKVSKTELPVERKLARAGGTINSSLYETGMDSGMSASMINELINAYSYDVDFQREIKKGDELNVLYERVQTKEGRLVSTGNIIFSNLELGDKTLRIYRYVTKDGTVDYYNEKGESVRKALLRTPINGAKITSGFGMRSHPILGYSKMHRGVDFGAPTGTPIYAAGDGTIEFIGQKGGYGNFLKIKHNNQYSSGYGHVSRFAAGMAPGKKVKQGQIVAYVGSTGMSTGPHLHYEIFAGGDQVNPANVKFKTGNVLAGKELASFRVTVQKVEQQLASMPRGGVVAMNAADLGVVN